MKLFKLFTTGLLLAIVALFFWQNVPAFQTPVPFQLNLYLRQPLNWTLSLCTLLFSSLVLGFLVGFALMLKPYFRARRLAAEGKKNKEAEAGSEPTADRAQ